MRVQCPKCLSYDTRPSMSRRLLDSLWREFSYRAFRCRACRFRFRRRRKSARAALEASLAA